MRHSIKLLESSFHRNGVGGEGFHVFRICTEGSVLFATITEDGEGALVPSSCRVIDPYDLDSKWRGDVIGTEIAAQFKPIDD